MDNQLVRLASISHAEGNDHLQSPLGAVGAQPRPSRSHSIDPADPLSTPTGQPISFCSSIPALSRCFSSVSPAKADSDPRRRHPQPRTPVGMAARRALPPQVQFSRYLGSVCTANFWAAKYVAGSRTTQSVVDFDQSTKFQADRTSIRQGETVLSEDAVWEVIEILRSRPSSLTVHRPTMRMDSV